MRCIILNHLKIFRIYPIVLGLLIVITGCDLLDNPPKTLHMAGDGISVNAKGTDGERPLHFAVYGNKIDMAKFLLEQGADINGINNSESTPLHGAAWKGHIAVAELLIAKGADVNVTNKMGKTPLDWAIEQGHTEMATLIRNHGGVQGEKDQQ